MANPNPFTPEEVAQILEAFFATVGTRQYIGARYVPIFGRKGEESIVWDNTKPYEPLTIVLYQGNSFTSRQYVPEGVDITNEEFWAETGNYNAQIEQYRQDVLNLQDTFDAYVESAEANYNLSYVGKYGAKENDSTVDWSSILSQIAEVSDTVYFGSGVWNVGTGIEVPSSIKNVIGSGATLIATQQTDKMLKTNYDRCSVSNINFNGNGMARRQLYCAESNRAHIIGCNFCNIGQNNIGLENFNIGCVAVGCTFNVVGTETYNYGGIGIKSHTDNQILGCKFFHLDYAILAFGINVGNCYFWTSEEVKGVILATENYLSVGDNVTANPNQSTFDAIFTNCEFDCPQTLVINPTNVIISACQFYWNNRDITTKTPKLFVFDGSFTDMRGLQLNDNVFKIQNISYHIYQFGRLNTSTPAFADLRISGYASKDNILSSNVYGAGTNALSKYHMLLGLNTRIDNIRSGSNLNCYVKQELLYNPNEYIPVSTYMFDTTAGIFKYNRVCTTGTDVRDAFVTNYIVRAGIKNYITVFYDNYGIDYLPVNPFVINNIFVHISVPFMFNWFYPFNENPTNMPTGLNVNTSRQITTTALESE